MELFVDLRNDDAYAFVDFLKRLTPADYRKYAVDEEAAKGAMAAGSELILAFRELGFITVQVQG